jgi:hypothetical protein
MTVVTHWRNKEEITAFTSPNKLVFGQIDHHWTVVYEESAPFSPTCLNRAVKIIAFNEIEEIMTSIKPYRQFLQTVGVAASPKVLFHWAEELGRSGVTRISALGKMTSPEPGWHHDGRFNLLDLVQIVDIEQSAEEYAENYALYTD